jgi:hypothetical protein
LQLFTAQLSTTYAMKMGRFEKESPEGLVQKLRDHFHSLSEAAQEVAEHVVRASSVIENLNSRLRAYFFLRRQLGPDYLASHEVTQAGPLRVRRVTQE